MRILDLSHHNPVKDWDAIKDPVILKCSQGAGYVDPTFKERQKEAEKRGLYLGSYHFADGADAIKEAEHYLDSLGAIFNGEILVLDYEINLPNYDTWCAVFCDTIYAKTGVRPLLYTNEARAKMSWIMTARNAPLWVAKYGTNDGTMQKEPSTEGWKRVLWQYTSRGKVDGIDGFVDLNTTELSLEELKSLGAKMVKNPSQILNLNNWKLTLPEGKPTEITDLSGYSDQFFYAQGDGVVFRAPVNGTTTSGSKYPRCELREMNGTEKASWSTQDNKSMYIDQAITHLPAKKKHVVAGQVHDANDDVLMIRLEDKKLFIEIDGKDGPVLDDNYELGKRFNIKIESGYGMLRVYYNGALSYTLAGNLSGCYFKAGCYTQSNCDKEDDCSANNYGEIIIYNLTVENITTNDKPMFEKCPRCGYPDEPQEQENEEMKTPLAYFWQRNPRYKGIKLGNSNLSLQQYGCFTMCLAYMVDEDPLQIHERLKVNGAYNGALIVSDKAAQVLGLEYKGKDTNIDNEPQYSPSIKEVSLGKSQHFVVRLLDRAGKKSIYDPWTGEVKPIAFYPFRSYRLFKRK